MKMREAMAVINGQPEPVGYQVSFERVCGSVLVGDYFPANNEPPIPTEEEAWDLARKFAAVTYGQCVNLYVTEDHLPVANYKDKLIINRDIPKKEDRRKV